MLVDEADDILFKKPEQLFATGANKSKIANKAARPKIVFSQDVKGMATNYGTPCWKSRVRKSLATYPSP